MSEAKRLCLLDRCVKKANPNPNPNPNPYPNPNPNPSHLTRCVKKTVATEVTACTIMSDDGHTVKVELTLTLTLTLTIHPYPYL